MTSQKIITKPPVTLHIHLVFLASIDLETTIFRSIRSRTVETGVPLPFGLIRRTSKKEIPLTIYLEMKKGNSRNFSG